MWAVDALCQNITTKIDKYSAKPTGLAEFFLLVHYDFKAFAYNSPVSVTPRRWRKHHAGAGKQPESLTAFSCTWIRRTGRSLSRSDSWLDDALASTAKESWFALHHGLALSVITEAHTGFELENKEFTDLASCGSSIINAVELAPQSGHVSNFCGPIGPVIELLKV